MRRAGYLLLVFLGVLSTLLPTPSWAEPRSYTLVCRGGGDIEVFFEPENDTTVIYYTFTKNPRPATRGLDRASCAWLDRPLNDPEANNIVIGLKRVLGERVHVSIAILRNGQVGGTSIYKPNSATRYPQILEDLKNPSREIILQAYSDRPFVRLIATRLGP